MSNIGKYHAKELLKDRKRGIDSKPNLLSVEQTRGNIPVVDLLVKEVKRADEINELAAYLPANKYKLCFNHVGDGWDLYLFEHEIVSCKAQPYIKWLRGKTIVELLQKYIDEQ